MIIYLIYLNQGMGYTQLILKTWLSQLGPNQGLLT